MAHQIDMTNGRANMAFVGDRSEIWHGLGQQLTEAATIDEWKVEAGMNWDIRSAPVKFLTGEDTEGNPVFGEFEGKRVLSRSDSKAPLSIVSDKYNIVQPGEVLEFFRDLTSDLGMKLSTAGCLFDGKRFWALADTGQAGNVLRNDLVKGYLLLTTSCDGTSPTIAKMTSERVVCNNTLEFALGDGNTSRASVRHRKTFSPEDIKKSLGLIHNSWDSFMESVVALSNKRVTDKAARKFIEDLIVPKTRVTEISTAEVRKVDSIMNLFHNGRGADQSKNTLWGLVNGVTEFVDHYSGGRTGDTQLWNSWYGAGNNLKSAALDKALELI